MVATKDENNNMDIQLPNKPKGLTHFLNEKILLSYFIISQMAIPKSMTKQANATMKAMVNVAIHFANRKVVRFRGLDKK
jgi:hypothetical protein